VSLRPVISMVLGFLV